MSEAQITKSSPNQKNAKKTTCFPIVSGNHAVFSLLTWASNYS